MRSNLRARKTLMVLTGAMALMSAAGAASAQWSPSDEPRFWWEVGQHTGIPEYINYSSSGTTHHPSTFKNEGRLVTVIRNKITFVGGSDPEEWAEYVCSEIQRRELTEGNVAIQPIDFGAGDREDLAPGYLTCNTLAWDNDDDLAVPTDYTDLGCSTHPEWGTPYKEYFKPWLDNGIADTQAWMDAFIDRYNELREDSLEDEEAWDIPLPSKWMLDVEENHGNIFSFSGVNSFWVSMQDPRWDTSPVLGLGSDPATGEAMDDYWASKGSPEPDNCQNTYYNWIAYDHWSVYQFDVDNLTWSAALKASTADVLSSYWPNCKFSNYQVAVADGVMDANVPPYIHRRGTLNTGFASGDNIYTRVGVKPVWDEEPDTFMSAPIFTGVASYLYTNGSTACRYCTLLDNMGITDTMERAKASLLLAAREDIESTVYSYGGIDPSTISPYVHFPTYDAIFDSGYYRRFLAEFRRLGVKEFNIWNGGGLDYTNADTFTDELLRITDQVWSTEVDDVSVITGTASGTPTAADLKIIDLVAAEVSGTQYTQIEVEFVGKLVNYDRFRVVVESSAKNGSSVAIEPDVEIQLYDYASASFVTVPSETINWWPGNPNKTQETTALVESHMDLVACGYQQYYDFVNDDGGVIVRVKHDAGSGVTCNSKFDAAQVYALDNGQLHALDWNGDGVIDFGNDYTDFVDAWQYGCGTDYNLDTYSDVSDLFDYTNDFITHQNETVEYTD